MCNTKKDLSVFKFLKLSIKVSVYTNDLDSYTIRVQAKKRNVYFGEVENSSRAAARVRFEVPFYVKIHIVVFWVMPPCSLVYSYEQFREICFLHPTLYR
jgi:hypothetical protein